MRRVARTSVGALAVSAMGCFPPSGGVPAPLSPAQVAEATAKDASFSAERAEKGRELFVRRCADCHNHPDLTAREPAQWPHILDRMARKADLSHADADAILSFILAAR